MLELTVRLLASLALVVGLLLLVVRLGGRRFKGRASAPVRVVHRQALTRSSAVAIIEVGGRMIVVGATDQQVSMLTELDPDTLDALELEPRTPVRSETQHPVVPAATSPTADEASRPAPFTPLLRRVIQPSVPAPAVAPAVTQPAPRVPESPAPPALDHGPDGALAGAFDGAFDGASFAAHLDSAVRSLRPAAPVETVSPAVGGSRLATGPTPSTVTAAHAAQAAQAARRAETFSLLDLLDAAEDVVEISSSGSHLAPTGTDGVVTALPVPLTPPVTPTPGLRAGTHAAQQTAQPTAQPGRARAGRRLATPGGDRLAPAPVRDDGPLAGSILSPGTWRQAAAAARGGRR